MKRRQMDVGLSHECAQFMSELVRSFGGGGSSGGSSGGGSSGGGSSGGGSSSDR